MQAGGTRGAVGEADGRSRSHPASSGMLSPGRCTPATSRAREDRAGTRRLFQGAELALRAPRLGGLGPPRSASRSVLPASHWLAAGDAPEEEPGGAGRGSPGAGPGAAGRRPARSPARLPWGVRERGGLGSALALTLLPVSGGVLRFLFRPCSSCHSGSQKTSSR